VFCLEINFIYYYVANIKFKLYCLDCVQSALRASRKNKIILPILNRDNWLEDKIISIDLYNN
jgi:hypothetical protein